MSEAERPSRERQGPRPDGRAGFLHVDMDAFYASVEIRRRPELRGRPVIVGGDSDRGVVAAASYEARAYGIHSAMPSTRARRLCPHAVFLPGDHAHYQEVSAAVMAILRNTTPLVEPLSLDEAFLDVRGVSRTDGSPTTIALELRRRVLAAEALTCSIGVASTKFLAKLATERAKPRPGTDGPRFGPGVHVIAEGGELDFLHPLPVGDLWGVGPATEDRLSRIGVETVGDLASLPVERAVAALGDAVGRHLHRLANGVDDRPVVVDRPVKSIGHEETFARDLVTREEVDQELVRMADAVATRLRRAGVRARTLTLKIRFGDFTTITRSVTPPEPLDGGHAIVAAAAPLLDHVDPTAGIRLFGVSGGGLVDASTRQLTFAELADGDWDPTDRASDRWGSTDVVVDEIRDRFGARAIGPAALVRDGRVDVRDEDANPWGPDRAG